VITYEVLFSQAGALEYADIIPAVVYNSNGLASNLPQPGVLTTATVSFAPIQSGLPNPNQPQPDGVYATPRFTSTFKSPADTLFSINSCATRATDSTASVKVTRGGFRLNYANHFYVQQVTVTNTSASQIAGPITLVLDGLSANASFNAFSFFVGGLTVCDLPGGSPFFYWGGGFNLDPGATASFTLQFTNPTNQGITYTTRVLTGSGTR
jgi:hypothetical protein